VEAIVTLDRGPRIIRFGFVGGQNILQEYPEYEKKRGNPDWLEMLQRCPDFAKLVGNDEWLNFGGHRLWHAPEEMPRTYWPDNSPVELSCDEKNGACLLSQEMELSTGILKEMLLQIKNDQLTITHRLTNKNLWVVELAPWAISVMRGGGRLIVPQEPFKKHGADALLPVRTLALWSYTQMSDPRFSWGNRFIQLKQEAGGAKTKFGVLNRQGWCAYALGDDLLVKRHPFEENATYPDQGCNFEAFTNATMLEIETMGSLTRIAPSAAVEHTETWALFKEKLGESEDAIAACITPLLEKIQP